jgi:hypothetical protein
MVMVPGYESLMVDEDSVPSEPSFSRKSVMPVPRMEMRRNAAALTSGPSYLLRQLFARLLANHVLCIPIWPVGIGFSNSRFMLPVCLCCTNYRLDFIRRICHVFPPLRSTESLNASVIQQNHVFPKAWPRYLLQSEPLPPVVRTFGITVTHSVRLLEPAVWWRSWRIGNRTAGAVCDDQSKSNNQRQRCRQAEEGSQSSNKRRPNQKPKYPMVVTAAAAGFRA